MRKRFEQQLIIGQTPITEARFLSQSRDSLQALLRALQEIFIQPELNELIFCILENKICANNKNVGRPGMELWQIFVMAQVRLCKNLSYDELHHMVNCDTLVRQIMGIDFRAPFGKPEIEYQQIVDNLNLLDEKTVHSLNEVIVKMGHGQLKKKETEALRIKTDSFVVESNVHFPTDYNLLWDSGRKCLDVIKYFIHNHQIEGWRKYNDWYKKLKNGMRILGKACSDTSKYKKDKVLQCATDYTQTAILLRNKLIESQPQLPIEEIVDLKKVLELEFFIEMLSKHIDLVTRRLIKEETIPHTEKVFSIFETYTEWITKGKLHPNVELGKRLLISTDQYNLIVGYQIMNKITDVEIFLAHASQLLSKYNIASWSCDKGFYSKVNKEILQLYVNEVVIPKRGKKNKKEQEEEKVPAFIRLRNNHSTIESNINELEHRGLDRCPDRGEAHFNRYIGLAVCAYNLRRIGKKLLCQDKEQLLKKAA